MKRQPWAWTCGLAGSVVLSGCGATRSGHSWGETATLAPTRDELLGALRGAALDPWTWAPLAGAALLSIDDLDEQLSDWAQDHTPVFGNAQDADDASDELRGLAYDAWIASMLAVPSGDELAPWARNKLQGYVVEWAATLATGELTDGLKSGLRRRRPDGSDRRSMPSGHTSAASAYAVLAARNVNEMPLPDELRWGLQGGLIGLAAGTAWARVEAGKHYPTDVLVGAALGNFVASFVHDAFLGPPESARLTAYVDPAGDGWSLGLAWSW